MANRRPITSTGLHEPRIGIFVPSALETDLRRNQAYVDGAWVDADSGATFPVVDPATGETIAEVPRMGAMETRRAIEAAQRALPGWKHRTAKDRARILRRLSDLMMERIDDLSALLVREQGKPLFEAKAEIGYAASFYEWFGEEAKRLDGRVIPQSLPDRRIVVLREAIGVTAGITPWNFPAAMPTRKSAPALAVGCTMVLKPAEQTPLTALAIAALAEEAGVPPGVFSVVTGDAADAPAIGGERVDWRALIPLDVPEPSDVVGVDRLAARRGEDADVRVEMLAESAGYAERLDRTARPVDTDREDARDPRAAVRRCAGDEHGA